MLSPQSQILYKILLDANKPLSLKEVASKMQIHPATSYRLAQPLLSMGLISKTTTYPHEFTAKPVDEGLSLFLLNQINWFSKQFPLLIKYQKGNNASKSEEMQFSFIQSRDELMQRSAEETSKAIKSVDLLRSGGEIPNDVMLAIIEAKKRGVVTRMLIQDYSKDNAEQVLNWQRNGILVRKTQLRHIRLMVYDSSIVYFMSYRNKDSKKDLGMKISYPPFAVILSQLFETWWKEAKII